MLVVTCLFHVFKELFLLCGFVCSDRLNVKVLGFVFWGRVDQFSDSGHLNCLNCLNSGESLNKAEVHKL